MTPFINELLGASLMHLHSLYPTFAQYYLASSDPVPPSTEDESIELPQLISSIVDFVAAVARGGRAREWFENEEARGSLVGAVFKFAQMTDNDVSIACIQGRLLAKRVIRKIHGLATPTPSWRKRTTRRRRIAYAWLDSIYWVYVHLPHSSVSLDLEHSLIVSSIVPN